MKAKISTWSKGLVLPWKCYIVLLEWRVNFFLINFPGSATRERLTFPLPLLKIYLSCWVLTALSCQPSVVAKSVSARKRKKGREKKKKKWKLMWSILLPVGIFHYSRSRGMLCYSCQIKERDNRRKYNTKNKTQKWGYWKAPQD